MTKKYDVVIIGAGSGGLSARREVAKKTDNYVVIDDGPLGTTCARVGCMPSKVLIQVANDFYRRKSFDEEGIRGADSLSLETKEVMKHVRKLRDRFVRGVTSGMESWNKEKLLAKRASFVDAHTLMVGDEKIEANKIIIATGSKPQIPKSLKGFEKFLITTDDFFELEDLPRAVGVIGLGVIGIELGQAISRLGVETLLIARRANIAGTTDPKLTEYVTKKFKEELNISFEGLQSVREIDGKLELICPDKKMFVDKVLVTTGRAPSLKGLNLEALDLNVNDKGVPSFCDQTFALKDYAHIYLAGDITGEKQILHEASDEGRIAGFNSVNETTEFQTRSPLGITFCDPNIASIGKTYKELQDSNIDFKVGEVSFEGQGRSIVKLKEIGMLRVYGDTKTKKILGSELFAPEGEHLAHLLSWVISQGLDVNEVLAMPFYHPVIEEGLRTALRDLRDQMGEMNQPLEIFEMKK